MKALKITVFILALLVLATQVARHVYVRYLEPRTSVLDKFEETETKKVIQRATTLSELVEEYDPARKRVDQLDKEMQIELSKKNSDDYYMFEEKWKEDYKQEYQQEEELKSAIQDWEENEYDK